MRIKNNDVSFFFKSIMTRASNTKKVTQIKTKSVFGQPIANKKQQKPTKIIKKTVKPAKKTVPVQEESEFDTDQEDQARPSKIAKNSRVIRKYKLYLFQPMLIYLIIFFYKKKEHKRIRGL